jgi:hypothetical protein
MPFANLPSQNKRSAPKFDNTKPKKLKRYFDDLQVLLDLHNVTDETKHKHVAAKYITDVEVESLWTSMPTYIDQTKTYNEFKDEIRGYYPGAKGDCAYTVQDLDMVIGHYVQTGIWNGEELGEYHRRFVLISRYLIDKNHLAKNEQSRAFFQGFTPALEEKVRQCL